ncbi:TPA: hypothetical protein RRT90_004852 [Klebsiella pneumoniae]|nr:hypothetical protein [Klebsiella pneumoniae]
MTIVKNHTGTVITKDGPQVKKLHQTERLIVIRGSNFFRGLQRSCARGPDEQLTANALH